MSRAKALCKRVVCMLLAFAFFIATPLLFVPASAATTPDTLKVYAQYWGDADTTVLLGEWTRGELDALSYSGYYGYEGYYCNVTRVCTVMRIHARGVKLKEFLSDIVGVDLDSVRQIDFHTTDIAAGARFVSKGRWELLDSPRYYYPNLMENSHIDYDLDERVVDNEAAASAGAVYVPTILAVVQYSTKNPMDNLSGAMTSDSTFRLCAGQPDLTTKTSFESAKWVDEIYIVFAGAPPEEDTTEPVTSPPEESTTDSISDESTTESTTDESTTSESTTSEGTTESTTAESTTREGITPSETTTAAPAKETTTKPSGKIGGKTKKSEKPAQKKESVTGEVDVEGEVVDPSGKVGRLVIDGYGSTINWKNNTSGDVTALQRPTVTSNGARNTLIFVGLSFAFGAGAMIIWFKKEI